VRDEVLDTPKNRYNHSFVYFNICVLK
jgi:hypothetical protein